MITSLKYSMMDKAMKQIRIVTTMAIKAPMEVQPVEVVTEKQSEMAIVNEQLMVATAEERPVEVMVEDLTEAMVGCVEEFGILFVNR